MKTPLVPEGLNLSQSRNHPGAKALLLPGGNSHQLADGLPGGGTEGAEELAVVHEIRPLQLGYGEHPLGVADVGDHLVLQEGGELGGAVRAADTWETPLEDAAVEVAGDHAVEEAAPEAVGSLEVVFPGVLDAFVERLQQRVQGCLGGSARPIGGGLHGQRPWRISCRTAESGANSSRSEACGKPYRARSGSQ